MVRAFREEPLDRGVIERILANGNRHPRPASPRAMDSWSSKLRRSGPASGRRSSPPATRRPLRRWPRRCSSSRWPAGRLPGPLRRTRQGLDRPRRGPLADPLLAHRHRLCRAADAVDRGRCGLGGLFFGLPPEVTAAVRAAFGVPADHEPIGGDRHRPAGPERVDRVGLAGAAAPGAGGPPGPLVSHQAAKQGTPMATGQVRRLGLGSRQPPLRTAEGVPAGQRGGSPSGRNPLIAIGLGRRRSDRLV
jgi:hypothetical protein